MKMTKVHCGYLPLVDCAPLIVAKELKFAAQEGLDLSLVKQPSWSALRDMLAFGTLNFAHMLSPMPLAMSLGLSGITSDIDVLMVLSVNGTIIGVSEALCRQMQLTGWTNSFGDPEGSAVALFATDPKRLRIGVPFPFSMHRMLLETWLSQAPGFRADRVEIVTVPPPKMADAVQDGTLDIFCVGEPWGSVAVQNSNATLILPGTALWDFSPEKVLGVRRNWAQEHPDLCQAMIRAIYKASHWLDQPENIPLATEILARSQHLDLPDHAIEPALSGRFVTQPGQRPKQTERFLKFHKGSANYPSHSQAYWIADVLSHWHQLDPDESRRIAQACFRTDIYLQALTSIGVEWSKSIPVSIAVGAEATTQPSPEDAVIPAADRFFSGAIFDFMKSEAPE
ncbi:CmpA/NrtA family ABC transporter substrate-binding protein [Phaeobacter sp. 11ANDIMAR09]|uniref:CmpA/NrtA family ABC transporter substrate-binding protein n=1 Tax=Phaeobacter sp. 11ANDIMAR09 TaxID=1225647 RepID=UPI0006C85B9E|nr:CmpA/NrtA family ABC transporter substrate-binding protein [Phaeobacter sp. 11ANDIMAR09]KPD10609.1 nitrate transporter [Phaeobacter sp. 11ANDIMAR09]